MFPAAVEVNEVPPRRSETRASVQRCTGWFVTLAAMGFVATYLAYLDPCIDSTRTKIIPERLSLDADLSFPLPFSSLPRFSLTLLSPLFTDIRHSSLPIPRENYFVNFTNPPVQSIKRCKLFENHAYRHAKAEKEKNLVLSYVITLFTILSIEHCYST